jgi:sugar lactone lactonase YvrE
MCYGYPAPLACPTWALGLTFEPYILPVYYGMLRLFTLRLAALLLLPAALFAQNVGIGTPSPSASAALEVKSTSGGLLFPRMTAAQRAAIANPEAGLFVFQTDGTPGLYYYIGGSWVNLVSGLVPDAFGNAGLSQATKLSTLAGSSAGYLDATGTGARLASPLALAFDGSTTLYVADASNQRIRKVDIVTGVVSTVAGSGTSGTLDGTGTAAQFNNPSGLALDGSGNLFVADQGSSRIRKVVLATGAVATLAGNAAGYLDGTGTAALFSFPYGLAADASGNLYVGDRNNHRIRKIVVATGVVTTVAGSTAGFLDATGTAAQFNNPYGVALDGSGNLYVADLNNNRIRTVVVATGAVSTLAGNGANAYADGIGTAAQLNGPMGVAADASGNVYVADRSNHRLRKIVVATGVVSTLAGSGTSGFVDGTGPMGQLSFPAGVAVDGSGTVYVADQSNNRVRMVK